MSYFAVKISILPSIILCAYIEELVIIQVACLGLVYLANDRITLRLFENSNMSACTLPFEGYCVVELTIAFRRVRLKD